MKPAPKRACLSLNDQIANVIHVICRHCNIEKKRISAGRYPNGKDTKWVDETMREWNGLMCPQCHLVRLKIKQKERRANRKAHKEKSSAKRRERYLRTGK